MSPVQIARLLTEDIYQGNGLILEYKLRKHILALLDMYPEQLNFGFNPADSNIATNKQFINWYNQLRTNFEKEYNIEITDNIPSEDFQKLITSFNPKLLYTTGDKLVSLLRSISKSHLQKRGGGIPGRTTALADKPHGAGRTAIAKNIETARDERIDQP